MGSGRGDPVHSIDPGGRRLRAGPLVEPGAVRVRALPGVRRAAAGDATLPGVHGHRVRHHEGPGHGFGAVGATRGERSGPAAALEGGTPERRRPPSLPQWPRPEAPTAAPSGPVQAGKHRRHHVGLAGGVPAAGHHRLSVVLLRGGHHRAQPNAPVETHREAL
uniref:(northern house mosquito) hypothetical protein n=1 Tax=Culex pipiens TaxID=7175 RepID=A0A8D8IHZ9_CULPI